MKILMVTMDYPPPTGGIQVMTKNLVDDLREAGHDVQVANFDSRNTNNYKAFRPIDLLPNHATKNSYFRTANILNPKKLFEPSGAREFVYCNLVYRVVKEARRTFQPDLVHITKGTLYSAVFQIEEPFIVSCHSEEIIDNFPIRYAILHATAVHCVSSYTEKLVRSVVSPRMARTIVIHNSVLVNRYRNRATYRDKIIIVCCRLVKRKNVDSVIRAFSLLPSNIQRDYRFVIIGTGPELQYLQDLSRELKLPNVDFLGEISDDEKVDWFCNGKLFVLCPKPYKAKFESNEEGFGITYIEAQAGGMPVVASNCGGIPESVGDAGILVEAPTNHSEIAEKIQQILDDSDLYQKLQHNALKRVKKFDRSKIFERFDKLYKDTIDFT